MLDHCWYVVCWYGYLATRLVSLANCLNMASLADDVFYKLLDEVKYVAFDSLRAWKTRPNLAGDCRNLIWKLKHLFKSVVHSGGCAVSK